MTTEPLDLTRVTARLARIVDRLDDLEVRVRGLTTRSIVTALEFLVWDERGVIRARLAREPDAFCLTFDDPAGKEPLKLSLQMDSSPLLHVRRWAILLV